MKKIIILSLLLISSCTSNKVKQENTELENSEKYGSTEIGLQKDIVYVQKEVLLSKYYFWIKDQNDALENKLRSQEMTLKDCKNIDTPDLDKLLETRISIPSRVIKNQNEEIIVLEKSELEPLLTQEKLFNQNGNKLSSSLAKQNSSCNANKQVLLKKLETKQTNLMIKDLTKSNRREIAQVQEDQQEAEPVDIQPQEPLIQEEQPLEQPVQQPEDYQQENNAN